MSGRTVEGTGRGLSIGTLLKGVRGYSVSSLVTPVVSITAVAVFSRVFTPSEYGRYTVMFSGAAIATTLGVEWLRQAVNRFLPGEQDEEQAARLKEPVAMAIWYLALAVLALSAVTGLVLVRSGAGEWLPLLVPTVVLVLGRLLFGPANVVLQAELRARDFATYRVLESVLRLAIALALVFTVYRDPAALLWAAGASLVFAGVLAWRSARLPVPGPGSRRARTQLGEFVHYGLPMVGWVLAGTLLYHVDRYLILGFLGTDDVGIYGLIYDMVFGAATVAAAPLLMAAHPFLMRSWNSGDRAATARWLGVITEWFLIFAIVCTAGLTVFARDIANVLVGDEFRSGYFIIPIVFAGIAAWQAGMYVHKPLEFTKRTRVMLGIALMVAGLNVLLNVLLIPRFGYAAAAWTTLASYAVYVAVTWQVGRRVLPWSVSPWWIGAVAAVAVGTVFAARGLMSLWSEDFWIARTAAALSLVPLAVLAWAGVRRHLPTLNAMES